jgi:hypothetical protein
MRDKRLGLTRYSCFRENLDLAVRQAEFFHSLWDDPGGAVAKELGVWCTPGWGRSS